MKILIIGNGFDLAHGLPTTYKDFLIFIQALKQVFDLNNPNEFKWGDINTQIKDMIINNMGNIRNNLCSQKEMWESLINNNFWIDYFLQWNICDKETWIDFETEIGNIVKAINKEIGRRNIDDEFVECENKFVNDYFSKSKQFRKLEQEQCDNALKELRAESKSIGELSDSIQEYQDSHPIETTIQEITYRQLIERLENDLSKLIRALEKYLVEYVEKMQIKLMSSDFKGVKFSGILSFNYTNTYERLYGNENVIFDYIHGKAKVDNDNSIESNNMVLGIDEFLDDSKKDKNLEFISFKKYYQRIYKETGCKYKEWVDEIRERECDIKSKLKEKYSTQVPLNQFTYQHHVFIFGHSLDVTDKDILSDLILNDSVHTTIYYKNKKTMGKQISNLVKIIGQDELIRRTGGSTKTIEFVKQKEMIPTQL